MGNFRKAIASISMVAILSTLVTTTAFAAYSDVPADHWANSAVTQLEADGVVTPAENFRVNDPVLRAEWAKMLSLAADLEIASGAECTERFPDCVASEWYAPYIVTMNDHQVLRGNDQGMVMPGANINRADLLVTLHRWHSGGSEYMGDDYFSDIPGDAYYNAATGWGYCYGIVGGYADGTYRPGASASRGETAVMLVRSMGDLTLRAECSEDGQPGQPGQPTVKGDLEVYVSGNTPGGDSPTSIPKNGFEIPYTTLVFDAEDSKSAVTVSSVVISRTGLGSSSDFSKVRLYQGNKQLGSEKTISSSTNTATFTNLGLTIPAGSKVEVEVTGDMSASAGAENRLGIVSAEHVVSSADVGGSFPAWGNTMRTSEVTIGAVEINMIDVTGGLEIGDTDEILAKVDLQVSNEDVEITRIRYKQKGSADPDDFANLMLYSGSTLVGENPEWMGDYAVFEFEEPLFVEKGDEVNLRLQGDIVGGIGNTSGWQIKDVQDVVAYGTVVGFRANVTDTSPTSITDRSISGGVVNFSLSSDNPPAQEIPKGGNDVEFMRFNVITAGDAIRIEDFELNMTAVDVSGGTALKASDITDVKGYKVNADGSYGELVFGPLDPSALVAALSFTDDWEIAAQTTQPIAVVADISTAVEATDTIRFDIDISEVSVEYVSDGTTVAAADITPAADITGSTMTVAAPTLTLTRASTPQSKTVVKNSKGVDIVGINARANTVSDLLISSLKLSLTDGAGTATYQDLSNCAVYYQDNDGVRTKVTQTRSLVDAATDYVTFSSIRHTVPKGQTHKLVAVCDIPTSATATNTPGLGVAATSDVTVEDNRGRTSTVTVSGTPNQASDATDVVVTIASSGTLTASLHADSPVTQVVSTGKSNVVFSKFKLRATNDAFQVTKFQLKADGGSADADEFTSLTVSYPNKAGETVTQTQSINSDGTANFALPSATAAEKDANAIYVPAGEDIALTVMATTASESQGADSGTSVSIDLDFDTNFEAFGVGANNRLTSVGSADITANDHTIYASDILVKASANTPTTASVSEGAGQEVFKFDVTANGERTPSIMAVAITSSGTATLDRTNATGAATLLNHNGTVKATESYLQDASHADGGTTTTFVVDDIADLNGLPIGATVLIYDSSVPATYARVVSGITVGTNTVTLSVALPAATATGDTITYVPLQPGSGKLYFGAATTVTANLADEAVSVSVASANGFAVGDTVTVRGTTDAGVVIECSGAITAITNSTTLAVGGGFACTDDETIDFDYAGTGSINLPPVAYTGLIDEEVTGTETFTVKGDITGATPSSGSKTVQLRINSGSDIAWNDDMPEVGDDVDSQDVNTRFIIQESNLNKEKTGYSVFPVNGSSLSFGS